MKPTRGVASILLLALAHSAEARVWYVNHAATGANDGTRWVDAFVDLQDALAAAGTGDEIWVAHGSYTPDRGTGDRAMSFQIPSGVAVYGGFAGRETYRGERNPDLNHTSLTGDLSGDDGPPEYVGDSTCCDVHSGPGCSDADCEEHVCQRLPNCCAFDGHWTQHCVDFAACCQFQIANSAENSYVVVDIRDTLQPVVLDGLNVGGTFVDEGLPFPARGVTCERAHLKIANCSFGPNVGSGVFLGDGSIADISQCGFISNSSDGLGIRDSQAFIEDSEFVGNANGLVVVNPLNALKSTVRRCTFSKNRRSGAEFVFEANVRVYDSTFSQNNGFGAQTSFGAHPSFVNSRFLWNGVDGCWSLSARATFWNCEFIRNVRGAVTGLSSTISLTNCLLTGHEQGGGVDCDGGSLVMNNCTVAANMSFGAAAGVRLGAATTGFIKNSIIVENDALHAPTVEGAQVGAWDHHEVPPRFNIQNSLIEGWSGALGGPGNFGTDPLFVDPFGPDGIAGTEDGDYRLQPDSPGINPATTSPLPLDVHDIDGDGNVAEPVPTELDGHSRVLCGQLDLGAYEFGIGDYDCDRVVAADDYSAWPGCAGGPRSGPYASGCEAFDFNADADIDLEDFSRFSNLFSFRRP